MLFDTTLRRDLARTFGATLVVLLTIVLTLTLVRTVGAAAQGRVSPQDVLLLLAYSGITQLAPLLALSLFVALVHVLGRMWRESEMVIWNAAGLALSAVVRPAFRMAWGVLLGVASLVWVVTPWVNQKSAELAQRYTQRSDLSRVTPGVFQSSKDGRSVFFIDRERPDSQDARSVFILTQSEARESLTTAKTGHLATLDDGRYLVLEDGHRLERDLNTGESVQARFDQAEVRIGDKPLATPPSGSPKTMMLWALWQERGPQTDAELVWRLGLVWAAVNLVLLGVRLSVSNPRKPSNWGLLAALLTFVLYFNLINLSQSWVASGKANVVAMVVGLHGGVGLAAWLSLLWRDQAWGWRLHSLIRQRWQGTA